MGATEGVKPEGHWEGMDTITTVWLKLETFRNLPQMKQNLNCSIWFSVVT
jgi:hypothetical protein